MLSAPEKQRLEKLLGMFTSDFDGEIANAARMIVRMASSKNLTVAELVFSAPGYSNGGPRSESEFHFDNLMSAIIEAASRFPAVLTEWELNFAIDIIGRIDDDAELTEKQRAVVEKILKKVTLRYPGWRA